MYKVFGNKREKSSIYDTFSLFFGHTGKLLYEPDVTLLRTRCRLKIVVVIVVVVVIVIVVVVIIVEVVVVVVILVSRVP